MDPPYYGIAAFWIGFRWRQLWWRKQWKEMGELDFKGEGCNSNEKSSPLSPFSPQCGHPLFSLSQPLGTSIIQKISFLIVANLHTNYAWGEWHRVMPEITEVQMRWVFGRAKKDDEGSGVGICVSHWGDCRRNIKNRILSDYYSWRRLPHRWSSGFRSFEGSGFYVIESSVVLTAASSVFS